MAWVEVAAQAADMYGRSNDQILATVLVATTSIAALLFAALLVAIAAGPVGLLGPGINAIGWVIAGAAGAYGVVGLVGTVGLWRGHDWAPVIAGVVQLIGTLGATIAVTTSGPQAPTLIGLALVAGGLVAVVAAASGGRDAGHATNVTPTHAF